MSATDLHSLLAAGVGAQQAQDHASAARWFERALAVDPESVAARHHLALALRALGRLDEAEAEWRTLMARAPAFAWAPSALGNLYKARARTATGLERTRLLEQAADLQLNALALSPSEPGHAHNLFSTFVAQDAWVAAADTFTTMANRHPQLAHFPGLAARAHVRIGNFTQARDLAQQALALNLEQAEAYVSLASALRELGDSAGATRALERALALAPDNGIAAFNLAQLRCYTGRWAEGLAGIAADRARQVATGELKPPPGCRLWQGQAEADHLLLLAEQGLGDTLQLVRYAQAARQRVARVTVVPPAGLHAGHRWLADMLSRTPGIDEVLRPGTTLPRATLFAPMFSLPHLCATSAHAVWSRGPYVAPDPARVHTWGQALGPRGGEFRVAIAWQGNPQYRGDTRRSMPLTALASVVAACPPKVRWLSLQKGFGAEQLQSPAGAGIEDWGARLDLGADTYADTAALLQHVDLVLSTDTSLPHLAGAMGVATWMMLAAVPDWRWQEAGHTSPWYPSMQLFRQTTPGDWASCVAQVQAALHATGHLASLPGPPSIVGRT